MFAIISSDIISFIILKYVQLVSPKKALTYFLNSQ